MGSLFVSLKDLSKARWKHWWTRPNARDKSRETLTRNSWEERGARLAGISTQWRKKTFEDGSLKHVGPGYKEAIDRNASSLRTQPGRHGNSGRRSMDVNELVEFERLGT
jgi:hypothetical protein